MNMEKKARDETWMMRNKAYRFLISSHHITPHHVILFRFAQDRNQKATKAHGTDKNTASNPDATKLDILIYIPTYIDELTGTSPLPSYSAWTDMIRQQSLIWAVMSPTLRPDTYRLDFSSG